MCAGKRQKRQTLSDSKDDDGLPATIEVFSGLYVNENVEVSDDDDGDSVFKERVSLFYCIVYKHVNLNTKLCNPIDIRGCSMCFPKDVRHCHCHCRISPYVGRSSGCIVYYG